MVIGTQLKCPSEHPLRGLWPQGDWRRGQSRRCGSCAVVTGLRCQS